jgi:hypothetical protein
VSAPRDPDSWISPQHDPFDAPDAEDEADTRARVLEGGEDAGDGATAEIRRELGLDDEEETSDDTSDDTSDGAEE